MPTAGLFPPFEARVVFRRMAGTLLMCLFCMLIGAVLIISPPTGAKIIGWIMLGLCSAGLARICLSRLRNQAIVTIDRFGIEDSRFNLGKIPWQKVKRVAIRDMGDQEFLCVELVDESPYLQSMTAGMRAMWKLTHALGFPLYTITFSNLDKSADDAIKMVATFAPQVVSESQAG